MNKSNSNLTLKFDKTNKETNSNSNKDYSNLKSKEINLELRNFCHDKICYKKVCNDWKKSSMGVFSSGAFNIPLLSSYLENVNKKSFK